MPVLRNFTDAEAKLLREKGIDPKKYYVDAKTGELFDSENAPDPTFSEKLGSGLRSVTRSFASILPQTAHVIGAGLESAGMGDEVSRGGEAMENWLDRNTPVDPRVSNWINVPGQVIGQLGQMAIPATWMGTGAKTAAALGSLASAGDTVHEERQRQELAGENDPKKALSKGITVGLASAIPERYGMGRVFEKSKVLPGLSSLFKSLEKNPRLMHAAELAATTVPTEAGEEGLQQLVVHGSDTTPEQLGQRMFWGGVGGAAGAGIGGLARRVQGEAKPAAKGTSNEDLAKGGGKEVFKVSEETLDAMETALRKGHKYEPPGKVTPVDQAFEDLRAAGVPMLREDIRKLFDTWGGNNANTGALEKIKRQMYDAYITNRPAKATPTPEFVKAQQEEMQALEDRIDTVKTRYAALQKAANDEAAKADKLPAGDRWAALNSQNTALRANEMKMLEDQLEVLVNQKASKLQVQPEIPGSSVHPTGTPERPPVMSATEVENQRNAAIAGSPQHNVEVEGEVPGVVPAPTAPAGQPVEPGPVNVEANPPATPPSIQAQAAEAVARAQQRITALVEHQSKLAQDPRRESPIQGVRQPVEDELQAIQRDLAFEMDQLKAAKKKLPPARPREVREFMQGAQLPGMEGEQRAPFPSEGSGDEVMYSGLPVFGPRQEQTPKKKQTGLYNVDRVVRYPLATTLTSEQRNANLSAFMEGSKVVNEDGTPKVVYHVSGGPIKRDMFGVNMNREELGTHFGSQETIGNLRAQNSRKTVAALEGAAVTPVYLRLRNPLRMPDIFPLSDHAFNHGVVDEALVAMAENGVPVKVAKRIEQAMRQNVEAYAPRKEGTPRVEPPSMEELRRDLIRMGYDGIVYDNAAEGGGDSYVIFDARQAKSATGNTGLFNPSNPSILYSGFPITWEMLEQAGGALGKFFGEGKANPVNMLYDRTRSVKSRLADSGPLGAWVAAKLDPMFNLRDRISNQKLTEASTFEKFVKDQQIVDWVFDSLDSQTENFDALPADKRDEARRLMEWSKSFINEMRDRDQYVRTGSTEPRLPEVIPGYLPTAVDQKVWEEIGTPEGYQKWEQVWVDNWRSYRPQDSEEQARALFRDFSAPISSVHAIGGEPLFMAARRAHGVPLPRAMRDRNLMRGFQNYIHSYALDAAWTEMVQKDPLMRRAFGVKSDHHFEDHSAEDEFAWPDATQWKGIRREAERVKAPWLERLSPDMPLGMPLLVRGEHGVAEALLASYAEQPANRLSANMKLWNGLEQIGSALLMQTSAGVRDVTMGVAELGAYLPSAKLASQFADVMGDYAAKRDAARGAGAVRNDVYRHQTANVVSKAAYQTARALREMTGRNLLDEFPRVFAYHAVREQVMTDLRESGHSPLAEEFGDVQAKSADDIADSTAAAVVNRIAPNYDARSLPKDWIPQTRSRIGMLTQLSTWGVARFNTWYEDHYLPAVKDKNPNRLFRSLLFGTIGGAAASALLEELFKRKPAKLTWQEWMGLSTEEQQKEAAPLLFSIIQTQGLLGVAGDIGLPLMQIGNRALTGGGPPVSVPDIGEASIPSLIIAGDMLNTTADFYNYIAQKKGHIDWKDMVDLANEYAKVAQTWRDMQGWFGDEEKLVGRERRMYERLKGVSAVTGEKLQQSPVTMYSPRLGSKFSLSKEFNTRTGADFQSLLPGLVDAARGGYVPNIMNREMRPEFWQDVVSRRGESAARSLYQLQEAQKPWEGQRRNVRAALRSLD